MKKPFLLVASAVLALVAIVASACGSVRPYAAKVTVDGKTTTIATADLDAELTAIRGNKAYFNVIKAQAEQQGGKIEGAGSKTFDAAFVAQILNRRVLVALVKAALDENHLKVTTGDRTASKSSLIQQFTLPSPTGGRGTSLFTKFDPGYQNDLIEASAAVAVLRDWLSNRATASSVRKYYDAHAKEFQETCIRHILAKDKAGADAARARVVGGEDFAAVAKAVSTDGSASKGGDLGCLTTSEAASLDPVFRAAEQKLATGEISQPVETSFGFHVIQVTQRRERPLDESLQQQIAGTITDISTFVRDMISKAKVSINPRYGTFDKANFTGVIPPKAPATSTTVSPLPLGTSPDGTQGSPTG